MARVLITGIGGFVGTFVAKELLAAGCEIWGIEPRHTPALSRLARNTDRVHLFERTLDKEHLSRFFCDEDIDTVIHLAGVNSSNDSIAMYEANVLGTAHLFEAVLKSRQNPKIIVMSSSAVYGEGSPATNGMDETTPFQPLSPYGVSKVAVEHMASQLFATHRIPIYRIRPFNLIGPGQDKNFLPGEIVSQLIQIERGQKDPVLTLANLDSYRDFIDVRDVVRGILLILEKGRPGDAYNLCSEVATSVDALVSIALKNISIPIKVAVVDKTVSNKGVRFQQGNCAKIKAEMGWAPHHTLSDSLFDMLAQQRES